MEKGRDELLAEAVRRALESEPGIGVKRLVAGLRASAPELSPNAKDVRALLAGLPAALRTPGAAAERAAAELAAVSEAVANEEEAAAAAELAAVQAELEQLRPVRARATIW